nr:unnamed protein product [Digitaria exilis]
MDWLETKIFFLHHQTRTFLRLISLADNPVPCAPLTPPRPPAKSTDDSPIMKAVLDSMVGDLGKKMDTDTAALRQDVAAVHQDQAILSTSIKNVQTQVLASKGHFDSDASSSGNTLAPPPQKFRFPKFDWVHKSEPFFAVYGMLDHLKYYRLQENQGVPSWKDVEGINRRFGPPLRRNPLGELSHLCRTSSVAAYQEEFLLRLARYEGVTEPQQITLFTAGLLQPLHADISSSARHPWRTPWHSPEPTSHTNVFPASLRGAVTQDGSTSTTSGVPIKPPTAGNRFTRLRPEELACRRLEDLCFNFPEKFSKEHAKQCTGRGIYY